MLYEIFHLFFGEQVIPPVNRFITDANLGNRKKRPLPAPDEYVWGIC